MDDTAQSESDSNLSVLSDTSMSSNSQEGSRKRKRRVRRSNYLAGKCRKVYKLSKGLDKSLQESPGISGVCSSCASSLALFAVTARDFYGFNELAEVMQHFDEGGIL